MCDVLEREGSLDFVRNGLGGAILADITAYGNPGGLPSPSGLRGRARSCPRQSPSRGRGCRRRGYRRAEDCLADRVEQPMENKLRLEPQALPR